MPRVQVANKLHEGRARASHIVCMPVVDLSLTLAPQYFAFNDHLVISLTSALVTCLITRHTQTAASSFGGVGQATVSK